MKQWVVLILLAGGAAHPAEGAVIVSYDMNSSTAPTFLDSSFTATSVTHGGGLTNEFLIDSGQLQTRTWDQANLNNARTFGDFVSFTVTPNAGTSVDVEFLRFDDFLLANGNNSPQTFQVGVIDLSDNSETLSSPAATSAANPNTINFSGLTFTNAFEVRIYAYAPVGGNPRWNLDNISLNGTINTVPEPSTCALVGLAAVCGWLRVRRRKRIMSPRQARPEAATRATDYSSLNHAMLNEANSILP